MDMPRLLSINPFTGQGVTASVCSQNRAEGVLLHDLLGLQTRGLSVGMSQGHSPPAVGIASEK